MAPLTCFLIILVINISIAKATNCHFLIERLIDTTPILKTEHLVLKKVAKEDLNTLLLILNDEKLKTYLDVKDHNFQKIKKIAKEHLKGFQQMDDYQAVGGDSISIFLGIYTHNNILIGSLALSSFFKSKVLYYSSAITPLFQNKGFATEAGRAILNYGHEKLKAEWAYAVVDPSNYSSTAVLKKLDFKFDSHLEGETFDYYTVMFD